MNIKSKSVCIYTLDVDEKELVVLHMALDRLVCSGETYNLALAMQNDIETLKLKGDKKCG